MKFARYLYAEKYVYCIQLHNVCPWLFHERPAFVAWQCGTKRLNQGTTSTRLPARNSEKNENCATLEFEETLHFKTRLHAGDFRTRRTGPYDTKQLKLEIREWCDDDDADEEIKENNNESEKRSRVLATLAINVNEYAGVRDRRVKLPLDCDKETVALVGRPVLELTINCLQSHVSDALIDLSRNSQTAKPIEKHTSLPESSSSFMRMKSSFWSATKSLGRNSFKSLFTQRGAK